MNPFQSLHDYEEYIYGLQRYLPIIQSSSVVLIRRGKCTAVVRGELIFPSDYRLVVQERLSCDSDTVVIESYGYEIWRETEKKVWYDSQPHPDDLTLASTHPHHKHIPPDIKHHRIPAPNMSFERPNLPALIREVERLIHDDEGKLQRIQESN